MTQSDLNRVFADISLLIEYCSVYFEEHDYASAVLDEFSETGVKLVVSETAWLALNSGIADRERMWEHLLETATEYLKDDELGATDYRSDILNHTSLEQTLDFQLNNGYLPDIDELREELESEGLKSFRGTINDARIQAKNQRWELEKVKDTKNYSRGESRGSWVARCSFSQYALSEEQIESFMDFGYWLRQNSGIMMLGSMCEAADRQHDLCDTIEQIANKKPKVSTPKEIFENTSVFD